MRFVFCATLSLLLAQPAHAATVLFDDLGQFLDAVDDVEIEGFDLGADRNGATLVFDTFTATELHPKESVRKVNVRVPGFTQSVVSGTRNLAYNASGASVLSLSDFDAGVTAFGGWLSSTTAGETITVTANGQQIAVLSSTTVPQFLGFTTGMPLADVAFDQDGHSMVFFDDIYPGRAASTPLPGSGLVMLSGIAMVGWMHRRKVKDSPNVA